MKQSFSRLWFFHLAFILIWLKTHIVQRYVFDLPIKGWYQEIIALISPLSAVLLMFWLAMMLSRKRKNTAILVVSFLSSFILFANAWYYRFFHDFITLPILFQGKNAGDLGNSAMELLHAADLLFFTDFVILLAIVWIRKLPPVSIKAPELSTVFVLAIICFIVNLGMAETVRPELLTRTFDRNILVKSIGTYNYHIYDLILSSKTKTQRAFATSDGLADVENYVKELPTTAIEQPENLLGIAKGKNVVLISMESMQNFVINNTLFGQEITPFLNDLIKESYYFDEFYHQTGQGKTSDAEFIMDNSLYPLPSGAVYFTHATNEYNATPKILKKFGYYSASLHANDKTFWNRDNMYTNLGYDRYISKSDYVINDENSVGWGLKDIPFFEQSVEHLKTLPQPFYSKLLTLTNHHPYTLNKADELIPEFDSGDGTVDRYFTTVRYTDEALKVFFEEMKESGLYENSIFILYGDHYGISPTHNEAMAKFMGKEITAYEQTQLQRVPLIIHIPGMTGGTISKVSGQIDVRPTLLHLLGIEGENPLDFGESMFADNPDPLIILRDGTFVTNTYIHTDNVCYQKGYISVEVDASLCDPYKEQAENDLSYSDKIIYGDLMRFTEELKQLADAESISSYPNGPYGPIDPNAPISLISNELILESETEQESLETWKLSPPLVATDEEVKQ
ncbi:MAG: LTA synthase family protein [Paenibacillaceae bacterium]